MTFPIRSTDSDEKKILDNYEALEGEDDDGKDPIKGPGSHHMAAVALCVMCCCVFLASVGTASAQILGQVMPQMQLNAIRRFLQILLVLPFNCSEKMNLVIPRDKILLLIACTFLSNIQNVLTFTAILYLPVGHADALMKGLTIILNAISLICVQTGQKMALIMSSILYIVGLICMLQPDVIFHYAGFPPPRAVNYTPPCSSASIYPDPVIMNATGKEHHDVDTIADTTIGYCICLVQAATTIAFSYAIFYLVQTVSPFNFTFWNSVLGSIFSLVISLSFEDIVWTDSWFCWLLIALNCLGNVSFFTPWAVQYLDPSICNIIAANKLVFLVIFQYTVLRDIKPGLENWVEILGTVVCFIAVLTGPLWKVFNNERK